MSNHFIKSFTFLYLNLAMSAVDSTNNTITIIQKKMQEVKVPIAKLEAEKEKLQAKIQKLEKKKLSLASELPKAELKIETLIEEILTVETKLEYSINKIEQIKGVIGVIGVIAALEAPLGLVELKKEQIEKLKSEIQKLEAEIQKLEAKKLVLALALLKAKSEIEKLEKKLEEKLEEKLIVAVNLEYNINKMQQIKEVIAALKENEALLTFQLMKTAALIIQRAFRKAAKARSSTVIQQIQCEIEENETQRFNKTFSRDTQSEKSVENLAAFDKRFGPASSTASSSNQDPKPPLPEWCSAVNALNLVA